jgi:membrane-bound lytic murein transglycosylase D
MDDRKKTFLSVFLLAVALLTAACGYNQQSRFQTSFLPAAPRSADLAGDIAPPPAVETNIYLRDVPPILLSNPSFLPRKTDRDTMLLHAQQSFERGKRDYQANNISDARNEFNTAVDLILQAAEHNPSEKQEYGQRLDEMVDAIHRFDLAGLGASANVEEGKFEKAPLEDLLQMTFPVDPKLKDRVRAQVASTVSQLPLSVNDTVLGYINYFSNRGHKTIIAATQRSGRYLPMIRRVLDEEGVPQELIHLAQAESGFIPRAISRKAAGGMWQFLVWRGNEYGLTQTKYTDDRMDPERATRAAARHLHDLYNEFGDWYLAIAAYNCGPGVVEKAVERTGYADFWELRSIGVLPAETTNYVPIILAMTIMGKNPAAYGLDNLQLDPPLEYDTIEVTVPTSLALVADITDTSMTQLLELNPAVIHGNTVPAGYSMHVPKGSGNRLMAALQLIPREHRDSWRLHRVSMGETLASIGKRYGATPNSIMQANHLQSAEAPEGESLLIPAVERAPEVRHRTGRGPSRRRTARISTASHRASASRRPSGRARAISTSGKKPVAVVASAAAR